MHPRSPVPVLQAAWVCVQDRVASGPAGHGLWRGRADHAACLGVVAGVRLVPDGAKRVPLLGVLHDGCHEPQVPEPGLLPPQPQQGVRRGCRLQLGGVPCGEEPLPRAETGLVGERSGPAHVHRRGGAAKVGHADGRHQLQPHHPESPGSRPRAGHPRRVHLVPPPVLRRVVPLVRRHPGGACQSPVHRRLCLCFVEVLQDKGRRGRDHVTQLLRRRLRPVPEKDVHGSPLHSWVPCRILTIPVGESPAARSSEVIPGPIPTGKAFFATAVFYARLRAISENNPRLVNFASLAPLCRTSLYSTV